MSFIDRIRGRQKEIVAEKKSDNETLLEMVETRMTSLSLEGKSNKEKISLFYKLYDNDDFTFNIVNYLSNRISHTYMFVGDEAVVNKLYAWASTVNLGIRIEDIVRDIIIAGTAWAELVLEYADKARNIYSIVIINPDTIDFIRDQKNNVQLDEEGNPVGYEQDIEGNKRVWNRSGVTQNGKVIYAGRKNEDVRDRIRYFKLVGRGDSFLGKSFISPAYRSAIIRCNIGDMVGESLSENRIIPVKIDGNFELMNFTELWSKIESPFEIFNGYEYKNVDKIETLTENGWRKVNRIIRHKHNGSIIRLANYLGETEATEQHSIFDQNNNVVPTLTFKETNSNFRILESFIVPETIFPIDLLPVLKLTEKIEIDADWINYAPRGICRGNPKLKFIYRNKDELKPLLKTLAWFITEGNTEKVSVEDKRCNSKYQGYRTKISNNNLEELKKLQDDLTKIFSGSLKITGKYDEQYKNMKYFLYSNSSLLHYLFKICLAENGEKTVPSFIFGLSNDLIEYFIEELVKGDGSISQVHGHNCQKYFDYSTSDLHLITSIVLLFKKLGWKYSIRYKEPEVNQRRSYGIRRVEYHTNTEHKMIFLEEECNSYVYDLEVPGEEHFYDAFGLIKVHNSAFRGGGIVAKYQGDMPADQKLKLRNDLKNITARNTMLLKNTVELGLMPIPDIQNAAELMYRLADFQASGMGIPLDILLTGGRNLARDLITKVADMETIIDSYHDRLAEQVNDQIISPLLVMWGIKPDKAKIKFICASPGAQLNRARVIATLARRNLMTYDPEMEIALRKELKLPYAILEKDLKVWMTRGRQVVGGEIGKETNNIDTKDEQRVNEKEEVNVDEEE